MPALAAIRALQQRLAQWHGDASLRAPGQWRRRDDVLDRLEDAVFDGEPSLSPRADALRTELEAIQRGQREALREAIRHGHGAEALARLDLHAGAETGGDGYDALDALLAGVLAADAPRAEAGALQPGMVFYQPTPARHLLSLLQRLDLREHDVLVDLGSGLGHLPLLAAILTPAQCIGIEIESAYATCAQRNAAALDLPRARFVTADARQADVSTGTVFYLYSPFTGAMLAEMLGRLQRRARTLPLRIVTLGPCTPCVAAEPWLRTDDAIRVDAPVLFHSDGGQSLLFR